MAKFKVRASIKHLEIDKANTMVLIAAAATTAIVIFSLIAASSLYKQITYKQNVISLRHKANKQLEDNLKSVNPLVDAYQTFDNSSESVIGTADKNTKIVLDALPSKYDFPALATSIDGLIAGSGAKVDSITGTDNEVEAEQDSVNPKPVEIPFEFTASGSYSVLQKLVNDLNRSIRPLQILKISLSGNDTNLKANVTAKTYYQPQKKLEIQWLTVSEKGTLNTNSEEANK